jgi:hypothetical protein
VKKAITLQLLADPCHGCKTHQSYIVTHSPPDFECSHNLLQNSDVDGKQFEEKLYTFELPAQRFFKFVSKFVVKTTWADDTVQNSKMMTLGAKELKVKRKVSVWLIAVEYSASYGRFRSSHLQWCIYSLSFSYIRDQYAIPIDEADTSCSSAKNVKGKNALPWLAFVLCIMLIWCRIQAMGIYLNELWKIAIAGNWGMG